MRIPIAMFHQVVHASRLAPWSISREKFAGFLDVVEAADYLTTTFEELNKGGSSNSGQKKLIITFDDCAAELFEFAIPELIKRHMTAVFFIPTAQIGGYNQWDVEEQGFDRIELMHAEQLQYLSSQGMEIGSHGHHHVRQSKLTVVEAKKEMSLSKEILEDLIQKEILSFSHPYAELAPGYRTSLKELGYKQGVSIYQAIENQYALRRFGVHETDTRKSMLFKMSREYSYFRKLADPLLAGIKKLKL